MLFFPFFSFFFFNYLFFSFSYPLYFQCLPCVHSRSFFFLWYFRFLSFPCLCCSLQSFLYLLFCSLPHFMFNIFLLVVLNNFLFPVMFVFIFFVCCSLHYFLFYLFYSLSHFIFILFLVFVLTQFPIPVFITSVFLPLFISLWRARNMASLSFCHGGSAFHLVTHFTTHFIASVFCMLYPSTSRPPLPALLSL